MARVEDIVRFLDEKAPFSYQMDFDNTGFLLGRAQASVSRVLVALDASEAVIDEAIAAGVQLIVTHHPLIWSKCSAVTDRDLTGRKLLRLIEARIAVISAHTNLDAIEGGVNSVLANALGLENPIPLHEDGIDARGVPYGIGRVGNRMTGETNLLAFVAEVKTALHLDGCRMMDAGVPVRRVAVGGGACGAMLADVLRQGCDTFVTAELKHDVYLEAKACGVNLIDAGHYATEALVCPVLKRWLQEAFPNISVWRATCEQEVFSYG